MSMSSSQPIKFESPDRGEETARADAIAILPFGVRSLHEEGGGEPGSDPGAPAQPRLVQKALWTTAVTTVLFAAFYAYVEYL